MKEQLEFELTFIKTTAIFLAIMLCELTVIFGDADIFWNLYFIN